MPRLAACLATPLHVVEPCGFPWDPVRLRRVALDYAEQATVHRHASWPAFLDRCRTHGLRIVLLSPAGEVALPAATFRPGDVLLGGRESDGVPDALTAAAGLRVRIPIAPACRSLNLVTALALAAGAALRQTNGFPAPSDEP